MLGFELPGLGLRVKTPSCCQDPQFIGTALWVQNSTKLLSSGRDHLAPLKYKKKQLLAAGALTRTSAGILQRSPDP